MRCALKEYLNILKDNVLFKNFELVDLQNILECLSGKVVLYKRNDVIILCGDSVDFIGIVLSGSIKIIKEDMEGNINILAKLGVNDIFAEAFAFAGIEESPITVQSTEDCKILFIDCKRIIKPCQKVCDFHSSLIENMLRLIATKNIMLNQKIEIISKRTTREKLLMFFDIQRYKTHSKKIIIPYNRETLAQYLCVDRSAMSRELCKMRDEGLIKFNKNEFEIF